nr:MAG TPA: hypothetical protein [Caudoviricetes sp.]
MAPCHAFKFTPNTLILKVYFCLVMYDKCNQLAFLGESV